MTGGGRIEHDQALIRRGQHTAGKIGDLTISRMLLGGNLLTHYTHSRDLKYVYNLTAAYNTEEKIHETMALAEAHGNGVRADAASLPEPDYEQALEIQRRVQAGLGAVSGFKVGERPEGAPVIAPIPLSLPKSSGFSR